MLNLDVIEHAQLEWASPIVFTPKKDESLQLCIDYRELNAVTFKDARNPAIGRVFGLARRSVHVHDGRRRSWVLADRKRPSRLGQDDIYIPSPTVQVFKAAFLSEVRIKPATACNGHHSVDSQVPACVCILGRCCHLRQICGRASGSPTDCTRTTLETWRVIDNEEMILLRGPYRLHGTPTSARQTCHIDESDQCNYWITKIYKRN